MRVQAGQDVLVPLAFSALYVAGGHWDDDGLGASAFWTRMRSHTESATRQNQSPAEPCHCSNNRPTKGC